jgi:hypothetical protein
MLLTIMSREGDLERETGIEPATNGLGSRYSTIELLPHSGNYTARNLGSRLGGSDDDAFGVSAS